MRVEGKLFICILIGGAGGENFREIFILAGRMALSYNTHGPEASRGTRGMFFCSFRGPDIKVQMHLKGRQSVSSHANRTCKLEPSTSNANIVHLQAGQNTSEK